MTKRAKEHIDLVYWEIVDKKDIRGQQKYDSIYRPQGYPIVWTSNNNRWRQALIAEDRRLFKEGVRYDQTEQDS